jgi:hypothetical protein
MQIASNKMTYMATISNTTKLAIFCIFCIALAGCSFFADFYVVNNSGKPVTATIQFTAPIDLIKDNETKLSLHYADTIFLVNDKTRELLTKSFLIPRLIQIQSQ